MDKIREQDLPFDQAHAAAAADVNPDFPGSCGRCYEIRCKTGVVPRDFKDSSGAMTPFKTADHFYMPKYDPDLKDDEGRTWLGNPWEKDGLQGAVCWSNASSTWVRIVDSCPPNPNSPWCAAESTVPHFDMSYWAFQRLAHPLYGVMPIQFRPVDCDSRAPLPYLPGSISKTIYASGPSPGWSWQTWKPGYQLFTAPRGVTGTAACASLLPDGGMRFICRGCERAGYQPFAGAGSVSFALKADDAVLPFPASPAGSIPPLKVYLVRGSDKNEAFCGSLLTASRKPTADLGGGWFRYDVPLSEFGCATTVDATGIGFSHAGPNDYVSMCVDDIKIGGGGGSPASGGGGGSGDGAPGPAASGAPSPASNSGSAGGAAPRAPAQQRPGSAPNGPPRRSGPVPAA